MRTLCDAYYEEDALTNKTYFSGVVDSLLTNTPLQ